MGYREIIRTSNARSSTTMTYCSSRSQRKLMGNQYESFQTAVRSALCSLQNSILKRSYRSEVLSILTVIKSQNGEHWHLMAVT